MDRIGKSLLLLLATAPLLAVPVRADSLSKTEILDLFSQGKELFRQANELVRDHPDEARDLYRRSALRFERIVEEGNIHNGKLFYNIGNIYFRLEDLGRAILYYRRAEQYIPNDPLLHQNLSAARAKRLDKIEEQQRTRVLRTVFFWHYDLSGRVRSVTFMIAYCCFWGLALAKLFVRRPWFGWPLALAGLIAILFLGSLVTESVQRQRQRPGVILAREVVARKGDSDTYERSFTEPLHSGTEFRLLEDRPGWYNIELEDGHTCWVPAKDAALVR